MFVQLPAGIEPEISRLQDECLKHCAMEADEINDNILTFKLNKIIKLSETIHELQLASFLSVSFF